MAQQLNFPVSIPTGSIKIVYEYKSWYLKMVSIPTGSIKMLSPTMHRLQAYVSIPTGSIKIIPYRLCWFQW